MKSIIFSLTTLLFLTMTTQAQTSTAAEDAVIKQLVQYMEDGWTKKDGTLFATPFAENADYVVINGMHIKGKKAIAAGHQSIFDTFYKETFIKTTVESIRYLRPDIAIVHVGSHMTGVSNGEKVDGKGRITLTVEKTTTGWQIAAFQNTGIQAPGRTGN